MDYPKTNSGLIFIPNKLCVSKVKDDTPFDGQTAFQIEPAGNNFFPYQPNGAWITNTDQNVKQVYVPEYEDYALRMKYSTNILRSWNIGVLGSGQLQIGNVMTFSVYQKAEGTHKKIRAVLFNQTKNQVYKVLLNNVDVVDQFKRYTNTFTITSDQTHASGDVIQLILYGPHGSGMIDGYNYYMMPQLELGNVATSFIPSQRPAGLFLLAPNQLKRTNFQIAQWFKVKALKSSDTILISKSTTSTDGIRLQVTSQGKLKLYVQNSNAQDTQNIGQDWMYIVLYGTQGEVKVKVVDSLGIRTFGLNIAQPISMEEQYLSIGNTQDQQNAGYVLFSQLIISDAFDEHSNFIWSDDYIKKIYDTRKPFDQVHKARLIPYHEHDSRYVRHYDGKLGLGTESPAYILDVRSTARINTLYTTKLTAGIESTTNQMVRIKETEADSQIVIEDNASTPINKLEITTKSSKTTIKSTKQMDIAINNQTYVTLTESGNLGLGTTSPTSKLTIVNGSIRLPSTGYEGQGQIQCSGIVRFANGSQAQQVYARELQLSDSWADADSKKQTLGLYSKGNVRIGDRFILNATDGKLGINTLQPNQNLDVVGNAVVTGTFQVKSSSQTRLIVNDTTGKVGINVSNPEVELHIGGSVRGNQNGALRINTGHGYIDIGPQNQDYQHFYTDRPGYMFDKNVRVPSLTIQQGDSQFSLTPSIFSQPATDVSGNLNVSGNITQSGNLSQQTAVLNTLTTQSNTLNIFNQISVTNSSGELRIGLFSQNPSHKIHFGSSVRGNGTEGSLVINTNSGTVSIGVVSGSQKFSTNAGSYLFDKQVYSAGGYKTPSNGTYYINPDGSFNLGSGTVQNLTVQNIDTNSLTLPSTIQASKIILTTTSEKPIDVRTQALVDNLNSDLLDGYHASVSQRPDTVVVRDSSGRIQANGFSGTGQFKVQTSHGYIEIGPQNSDWAHFYTDRAKFYFNKEIHVDGNIRIYNTNVVLGASYQLVPRLEVYDRSASTTYLTSKTRVGRYINPTENVMLEPGEEVLLTASNLTAVYTKVIIPSGGAQYEMIVAPNVKHGTSMNSAHCLYYIAPNSNIYSNSFVTFRLVKGGSIFIVGDSITGYAFHIGWGSAAAYVYINAFPNHKSTVSLLCATGAELDNPAVAIMASLWNDTNNAWTSLGYVGFHSQKPFTGNILIRRLI